MSFETASAILSQAIDDPRMLNSDFSDIFFQASTQQVGVKTL